MAFFLCVIEGVGGEGFGGKGFSSHPVTSEPFGGEAFTSEGLAKPPSDKRAIVSHKKKSD